MNPRSDAIDLGDYSAIVKRRPGDMNKWRWEIHRAGRSSPTKSSEYIFTSITDAKRAADAALQALIGQSRR